jgi:hypothetical protein
MLVICVVDVDKGKTNAVLLSFDLLLDNRVGNQPKAQDLPGLQHRIERFWAFSVEQIAILPQGGPVRWHGAALYEHYWAAGAAFGFQPEEQAFAGWLPLFSWAVQPPAQRPVQFVGLPQVLQNPDITGIENEFT